MVKTRTNKYHNMVYGFLHKIQGNVQHLVLEGERRGEMEGAPIMLYCMEADVTSQCSCVSMSLPF